MHERAIDGRVPCVERLAVSGLASVDCRGGVRKRHERDSSTPELQQVLRHHVAGAAVVDAYQIMVAALRIRRDRPVEQHDRNPCRVERLRDLAVHVVFAGGELERGEEYP
jgi:hypothetical protein